MWPIRKSERFLFSTRIRREVDLIKNSVHAHFVRIIGLAMDDNDRLFVSDPGLRHVLIFDKDHKAEDVISDGMSDPGGLAIDTQNRLLYVADIELDQSAGLRRGHFKAAS